MLTRLPFPLFCLLILSTTQSEAALWGLFKKKSHDSNNTNTTTGTQTDKIDSPACSNIIKETELQNYLSETKSLTTQNKDISAEVDIYRQLRQKYGEKFANTFNRDTNSFAYLSRQEPTIKSNNGAFTSTDLNSSDHFQGKLYDAKTQTYAPTQTDPASCFTELNKTSYFPGNKSSNKSLTNQQAFVKEATNQIKLSSSGGVQSNDSDSTAEATALQQSFLNSFLSLPEDAQAEYLKLATDHNAFDSTFLTKEKSKEKDKNGTYNFSLANINERKKILINGIPSQPCLLMVSALRDKMDQFSNQNLDNLIKLKDKYEDKASGLYSKSDCKKIGNQLWYELSGKKDPHQDFSHCIQQRQNCEGSGCEFDIDYKSKFQQFKTNGRYQSSCVIDANCQLMNNDGKTTIVKLKNVACEEHWCMDPKYLGSDDGRTTMITNCVNHQYDDDQATLDDPTGNNTSSGKKAL